jgi:hypothetical protein
MPIIELFCVFLFPSAFSSPSSPTRQHEPFGTKEEEEGEKGAFSFANGHGDGGEIGTFVVVNPSAVAATLL